MEIMGITAKCAACEHWCSQDGEEGRCFGADFQIVGGWKLITTALAGCALFEPSAEAVAEHKAEADHWKDMKQGVGVLFPASLGW